MVLKGNKMFRSSLRRACDDLWSVVQDQEVAMLNFDGYFSVLLICLPEFTVQTDAERFQEAFENGLLGLRFRGWITRRRILMRSEYSSRCFDTPNSSTNRRSLSFDDSFNSRSVRLGCLSFSYWSTEMGVDS